MSKWLDLGFDGTWVSVSIDGNLVLIVEDNRAIWNTSRKEFIEWSTQPNKTTRRINKQTEAETLAEICDVKLIHIRDFSDWKKTL